MLGVEDLTDITLLQNCKWIFSILDIHSKPHISEEYKRIGVTKESKSCNLLEWLNGGTRFVSYFCLIGRGKGRCAGWKR
jgi:hypothetical protein